MKTLKNILYIILILLNIASLYVIIDLSNYDEIIGYLKNGAEKFSNPREIALVFLITCVANLLFVCIALMKSIIFSKKYTPT